MTGINQIIEKLILNQSNNIINNHHNYSIDLANKFMFTINENKQYHSFNDNPAIIYMDTLIKIWMDNGNIHRINQPAIITNSGELYFIENYLLYSTIKEIKSEYNLKSIDNLTINDNINKGDDKILDNNIFHKYIKQIIIDRTNSDEVILNIKNIQVLNIRNYNNYLSNLIKSIDYIETLNINMISDIDGNYSYVSARDMTQDTFNSYEKYKINQLENEFKNIKIKKLNIVNHLYIFFTEEYIPEINILEIKEEIKEEINYKFDEINRLKERKKNERQINKLENEINIIKNKKQELIMEKMSEFQKKKKEELTNMINNLIKSYDNIEEYNINIKVMCYNMIIEKLNY
jgi:hypothetical protein